MSTSLEELYRDTILEHSKRPRRSGLREPFDAQVHQVNPVCGDEVTLRLRLGDGSGAARVVEDVSYDAHGCSISQAATSVMADALTGRTVQEFMDAYGVFHEIVTTRGTTTLDPLDTLPDDLADALGDAPAFAGVARYPARVKCALLGWTAFKQAIVEAA
ncbi:Fe-S cluster assembly sulfur transfer protein SufU [Aquipuribacter nitratireducens]|uniref:Fe-S cluster assembly sulfur transfer protein SufU n=1 Tax=Aquipuribacter nitratireducens TaxID=650104 RepID=A0ABW0GMW4_9MICO